MNTSNVRRQKIQQSKEELLIKNLPQIMERNLIKKQNRKKKIQRTKMKIQQQKLRLKKYKEEMKGKRRR